MLQRKSQGWALLWQFLLGEIGIGFFYTGEVHFDTHYDNFHVNDTMLLLAA